MGRAGEIANRMAMTTAQSPCLDWLRWTRPQAVNVSSQSRPDSAIN